MRQVESDNPRPGPVRLRNACPLPLWILLSAFSCVCISRAAVAVTDLERGDEAPAISAISVDGHQVDTLALKDTVLIVLFGETEQARTESAYRDISATLEDSLIPPDRIVWLFVLSKHSRPQEVPAVAEGSTVIPILIHDVGRTVFGEFKVMALPSAVIIDPANKVVHAMAGENPRLGDIVRDAVLLGLGRISAERFQQTLTPANSEQESGNIVRAERLTRLAEQLSRRGMTEAAEAKYLEALEELEECVAAQLGLGLLYLRTDSLSEAEIHLEAVLEIEPESERAILGLASVCLQRGDKELPRAEELVSLVIERDPLIAHAHYLNGLIHERNDRLLQASQSFKRAAELLLRERELRSTAGDGEIE